MGKFWGPTGSSGDNSEEQNRWGPCCNEEFMFWLWKNTNSYNNNEMSVKKKENQGMWYGTMTFCRILPDHFFKEVLALELGPNGEIPLLVLPTLAVIHPHQMTCHSRQHTFLIPG